MIGSGALFNAYQMGNTSQKMYASNVQGITPEQFKAGGGSTSPNASPFAGTTGSVSRPPTTTGFVDERGLPRTSVAGMPDFNNSPQEQTNTAAYNLYGQYLNQAQNSPEYLAAMQGLTDNAARLKLQMGQLAGARGQGAGLANEKNALDNRSLDLKYQNLDIDKAAGGRDLKLIGELDSLANEQFLRNRGMTDQQIGFAGQVKDLAYGTAGLAKSSADRAATSSATGRGAITSAGFGSDLSEIAQQYGLATGRADLDYTQTKAGLDKQNQDLIGGRDAEWKKNTEDAYKAQDRLKQLDLLGEQYGIDREALANALKQGLNNLNIQGITSTNQVMDMLASNDAQQKQLAMQIAQQAMNAASGAKLN